MPKFHPDFLYYYDSKARRYRKTPRLNAIIAGVRQACKTMRERAELCKTDTPGRSLDIVFLCDDIEQAITRFDRRRTSAKEEHARGVAMRARVRAIAKGKTTKRRRAA